MDFKVLLYPHLSFGAEWVHLPKNWRLLSQEHIEQRMSGNVDAINLCYAFKLGLSIASHYKSISSLPVTCRYLLYSQACVFRVATHFDHLVLVTRPPGMPNSFGRLFNSYPGLVVAIQAKKRTQVMLLVNFIYSFSFLCSCGYCSREIEIRRALAMECR